MKPCPPRPQGPVDYEISYNAFEGGLHIEAHLVFEYPNGRKFTSMSSYLGPHPSHAYVHEPGWLARLFGDTIDKRCERAKQQVTKWAIREIAQYKKWRVVADGQKVSSTHKD